MNIRSLKSTWWTITEAQRQVPRTVSALRSAISRGEIKTKKAKEGGRAVLLNAADVVKYDKNTRVRRSPSKRTSAARRRPRLSQSAVSSAVARHKAREAGMKPEQIMGKMVELRALAEQSGVSAVTLDHLWANSGRVRKLQMEQSKILAEIAEGIPS